MFTATKDDVKNYTASNANDPAHEARKDLRDAAETAGRKVRGFLNSAGDEIVNVKDTVATEIRTNPVQSALIALGVGIVIGAISRR